MQGMTKRQQEIVDYIESFITSYQISPTYREIQKHFQLSSLGTVYSLIQTLKRKGVVEGTGARSLKLTHVENKEKEIPFIGKIVETLPIQTFAQITQLAIPIYLLPNAECYLVQIEGSALTEELIMEGDLLIVEPRTTFEPGELVLALIDEMTSLIKKAYNDGPYFRFESVNMQIQPLIIRQDHVEIQGVVSSLLRNYHI